jgi:hypothetical protein
VSFVLRCKLHGFGRQYGCLYNHFQVTAKSVCADQCEWQGAHLV